MTLVPESALSSCSFIFWPLLALWIVAACTADDPQSTVTLYPQNGTALRVSAEIVDTNEKRALGLMYRRELPELHGMLFLFPRQEPLSFWMKNTPLPLDILFIDSSLTIVGIAQNTTPFSEKVIPSDKPAQFVLEVNGGFCQRHGVAVGDRIELPRH
jgi:uncharacterized protein